MCRVSIDVDEVTLKDLRPELNTAIAIRSWVQELVDKHLQRLWMEDEETINHK